VGERYICAVVGSDSHVECWGLVLDEGNTAQPTPAPIPVNPEDSSDVLTNVRAIATRSGHLCALTWGAGVECLGLNLYGELGDGTYLYRRWPSANAPVISCSSLQPLENVVTAITSGWGYSCALIGDSTVQCWGENDYGQLGDGTTTFARPCADPVVTLSGVQELSAGSTASCAQSSVATSCWGALYYNGGVFGPTPTPINF
jgi:alpha-tubulin suppressor-like RCC1 family protein